MQPRFELQWSTPVGELRAIEPVTAEVRQHARALAVAYNDPRNAALLSHTEMLSEADVLEHYASGGRMFLLFRDGTLSGDGDLRGISHAAAEFAFLIASPDAQGKGLGTRFAIMLHAFAFAQLEVRRVYASVVPQNVASRRVFEKLGYLPDASAEARACADAGDVTLSVDRATFDRLCAGAVTEIRMAVR